MSAERRTADEPEYLVTTYRDGRITEQSMTRSEVLALDPDDVDCHVDEAFGRIQIRRSEGGTIQHLADIPGIGEARRKALLVMMNRPGEFLCPRQLAALTGNRWLCDRRNLASYIRTMRMAFGETGNSPFYFLTRKHPYAAAWCADRAWRQVEAIALPLNGNGQGE